MPRIAVRDGLCRLCTYLEELEAVELKKFKLYLGTATEMGETRIPWGRMETAGPLEMAQLLVAHCGIGEAWLLALSIFDRINRKDLWERGQREDLVRGKEVVMGPSRLQPTNSLLSDNRWAHKAWVLTYPLGLCSCCVLPKTPFLCLFLPGKFLSIQQNLKGTTFSVNSSILFSLLFSLTLNLSGWLKNPTFMLL